MILDELRRWWQLILRILMGAGVLLSFLIVMDLAQAYVTLRAVHPVVGYVFAVLLLGALVWLTLRIFVTLRRHPKVLRVPAMRDPQNPTPQEQRKYLAYLTRYSERLLDNECIATQVRAQAETRMKALVGDFAQETPVEANASAIERLECEVIEPLIATLDDQAQRMVRDSTRDVMLGVAFLPWRSADLLLVLVRNATMVLKIVSLYNSRPLLAEQATILRDTLRVVAAINFLNLGQGLIEGLGKSVPVVGRHIDNKEQGFGAGFLTSVTGHAAIERCRAFKGWHYAESVDSIGRQLKHFYADVGGMVGTDLMPRLQALASEKAKRTWDKVTAAVASTLRITSENIGQLMRKGKPEVEPAA